MNGMKTAIPTHRSFRNHAGKRFGRWTVVSYAGKRGTNPIWNCVCDCGTEKVVLSSSFLSGASVSCGCVRSEQLAARLTTHGHAPRSGKTPEYSTWKNIVSRCTNPKTRKWEEYGGRGIKVCDRWRESFAAFLADVGLRPSKQHTIERKDNDGNYEPGNVCWATRAQQSRNKRNNRWLTFQGETLCIRDWGLKLGLSRTALNMRIQRGWSVEKALTTPPTSR